MAGFALTAAGINDQAGSRVNNLWRALDDVHQFYLWLSDAAHTDTFLNNTGVPGTTGSLSTDVGVIRAGISDLGNTTNGLWAVSHGLFVPGGVNNFFANAKNLTGVYYGG